jgi:pyruvate formate-lyase activating enzyme-like uncharacterized protein
MDPIIDAPVCVRNPALSRYMSIYDDIQRDFDRQISDFGLEVAEDPGADSFHKRLATLAARGAVVRNGEKSVYTQWLSPACEACRTGEDSETFFISLKCHRDCFFCFNPNQENYAYYLDHQRDLPAELEEAHRQGKKLKVIGLTGGEPLLYPAQTLAFFREARQLYPKAHMRLYTSGDQLSESLLDELRDAGLDEIRISIRLYDLQAGHLRTFDKLALATRTIPTTMVEMPVLPGTLEQMEDVLLRLDSLGVRGINLLEFCFPLHNAEAFHQRGYRIKPRPYRVLYNYWYAGGLPVMGSEEECLQLVDFALDRGLKLGVHYCSLENKHTGQIYQQNKGHALPNVAMQSPHDAFIKTAKVFGEDVPPVLAQLQKRAAPYRLFPLPPQAGEGQGLEFHPREITALKPAGLEIGLCTHVFEERGSDLFLRELKVEVVHPQGFRLDQL